MAGGDPRRDDHPVPLPRRAASVALLLSVALSLALLSGCAGVRNRVVAGLSAGATAPMAPLPPMGEVEVARVDLAPVKPAWSKTFSGPAMVYLSPAGDYAVANLMVRTGQRTYPALQVIDPRGATLWERQFKEQRYRYGRAAPLAAGKYIGVVVLDYDDKGLFYLFDRDGGLEWSPHTLDGSVTPLMPGDGSFLLLVDDTHGRLVFLDKAGEETLSLPARTGIAGRCNDGGDFLILLDGSRISLVDRRARPTGFEADLAAPTDLQISPDGRYVAAVTEDGETYLHLFRRDGNLLWKQIVDPGGTNKLVFSSDGKLLLLYDFGSRGGLAMIRVPDGAVVWRSYFAPRAGRRGFVRAAIIRPSGEVTVHYVEGRQAGRESTEESFLVGFDPTGQALWRLDLGINVDVGLARDGNVATVTTNAPAESEGQAQNRLVWYDLMALYKPAGAK